mmetsp:Transcript_2975/g.7849  ORF Transcript_2975/g.7849 Transcript_2975/m.7849 type:complete len:228 (+) Transcript_2975:1528-2211(+)
MIVIPRVRDISLSTSTRICAMLESRPDVGSSSSITAGSTSSSCAMHSRLRSPPEMPRLIAEPTSESATPSSRSSWSVSSTRALIAASSVSLSRSFARKVSDWRTLSSPYTMSSCSTKAMRRLSAFDQPSPPNCTSPSSNSMRRASALRRVVFPAPLGPMSAVSLPERAMPDTPLSACVPPTRTCTPRHTTFIARSASAACSVVSSMAPSALIANARWSSCSYARGRS